MATRKIIEDHNEKEILQLKLRKIHIMIAVGVSIVIASIIAIYFSVVINDSKERMKVYSITIDGATDEQCSGDAEYNECKGTITLPANIDSSGRIADAALKITGTEGGELSDSTDIVPGAEIEEDDYNRLSTATKHQLDVPITIFLKNAKTGERKAVYELTVIYSLSDNDRNILSGLEQKRQAKIIEEQRRRAEAEAIMAEQKRASTPFSYTSSKCGFQGDVFCLLVSDFVADDVWRERIKATINDFISKTSAVTPSKHLIYVFKSSTCYKEKINSNGLSVCDEPGGQIASSMDTNGITWSYGQ